MSRHGVRPKAWLMILLVGGGWFLEEGLSKAASAEKEIRIFNVKVDNKPAWYYKMTISCPDDHTFTVDSDAHVSVSRLFIKVYTYTYQGTEVWKDSRLVYLKSTTNDDGTQFN